MAVIKRVSAGVAEPGDLVTFTIQYRNMGNTPISSVSIIDSLLPRLEYVPGSARARPEPSSPPRENRAGSTELRWDLPGTLAPAAKAMCRSRPEFANELDLTPAAADRPAFPSIGRAGLFFLDYSDYL